MYTTKDLHYRLGVILLDSSSHRMAITSLTTSGSSSFSLSPPLRLPVVPIVFSRARRAKASIQAPINTQMLLTMNSVQVPRLEKSNLLLTNKGAAATTTTTGSQDNAVVIAAPVSQARIHNDAISLLKKNRRRSSTPMNNNNMYKTTPKKKRNKPRKRPPTAYALFFKDQQERIKKLNLKSLSDQGYHTTTNNDKSNIPAIVAGIWKSMDATEKIPYHQKALDVKFRFYNERGQQQEHERDTQQQQNQSSETISTSGNGSSASTSSLRSQHENHWLQPPKQQQEQVDALSSKGLIADLASKLDDSSIDFLIKAFL